MEGYAWAAPTLPVEHAWLVDADNHVIETTWPYPGGAYFGVAFTEAAMMHAWELAGWNYAVLDSGVTPGPDLPNVLTGWNVLAANADATDNSGHGTHVAGTVAAADNEWDVVGVAPGAPITGVKVLGCTGYGSTSGVIAGVDWVTRNARLPAVANMSLGGGASAALDQAVTESADAGVFYAIAAGNSHADACNYSPARAGTHQGVLTLGATDSQDRPASFSNYGSCVDLWAPGVSILSTRLGGGTTTLSGTSMASPHGAGTGALSSGRQHRGLRTGCRSHAGVRSRRAQPGEPLGHTARRRQPRGHGGPRRSSTSTEDRRPPRCRASVGECTSPSR